MLEATLVEGREAIVTAHAILGEHDRAAALANVRREQYGRIVLPAARKLLEERGSMTVAEILAALPPYLRAEIALVKSEHPIEFRLRRLFRRNDNFYVDRHSGRVSLASTLPRIGQVLRIVRKAGTMEPAGFQYEAEEGGVITVSSELMRWLLRHGGRLTVDFPNSVGELVLIGSNILRLRREDGTLQIPPWDRWPSMPYRSLPAGALLGA